VTRVTVSDRTRIELRSRTRSSNVDKFTGAAETVRPRLCLILSGPSEQLSVAARCQRAAFSAATRARAMHTTLSSRMEYERG
jgi:hypothetical protein